MIIENESYGTCSWCKVTGVHSTLVTWRWERGTDVKSPAVCGTCWLANESHSKSGTPVRSAAAQWTHLERKFGKENADEVIVTF